MVGKLIAIVVPLGLDTFAVAAALGVVGLTPVRRREITLLFGAFEAGMPLIGVAIGAPLGRAIGSTAELVAAAVLIAVGLYTLLGSEDDQRIAELASIGGLRSLALGLAISLDELAVGFALGLLHLPVVLVVALIAAQAVLVTQLGLRLGHRLGERLREGAERLAGATLATLGIVLALERLLH